jgi:biopolymer transport protein TolQ
MVAEITVNSISSSKSLISLISGADLVVQSTMLILLIASIWSWAIIIDKWLYLRRIKKRMRSFERVFSAEQLDPLFNNLKDSASSPIEHVFVAVMKELNENSTENYSQKLRNKVDTLMITTKNRHVNSLEKNLNYLATISSSAPFIGLFGTVWGIMHSFQSIAASKNTSLAVVAPGIAEALLATALGLVAAIPALIFYNTLTANIHEVEHKLENFSAEFSSILSHKLDTA